MIEKCIEFALENTQNIDFETLAAGCENNSGACLSPFRYPRGVRVCTLRRCEETQCSSANFDQLHLVYCVLWVHFLIFDVECNG
jgi:hypothetical protein